MPDWLLQLVGPILSGSVSGLVIVAGLRVKVQNLQEKAKETADSARRAHVRIDDHIDRHHVRAGQ